MSFRTWRELVLYHFGLEGSSSLNVGQWRGSQGWFRELQCRLGVQLQGDHQFKMPTELGEAR